MTDKKNKKQCIYRVYYPQNYNSSIVSNTREKLNNLLSEGWIVNRVIQNKEYFADYILEKE